MTLVDPFIPVRKSTLPNLVNNIPRATNPIKPPAPKVNHKPPATARPAQPIPVQPRPIVAQAKPLQKLPVQPVVAAGFSKQTGSPKQTVDAKPLTTKQHEHLEQKPSTKQVKSKPKSKRRRLLAIALKLRIPAAFAAMFVGGMLLQSLIFGQIAILAYAVLAFVRRIPSSTTITLAGISLLSIIVLNVKDPSNPLIGTFAVYAFLLLTVGVITLVREIYGQNKETSKA